MAKLPIGLYRLQKMNNENRVSTQFACKLCGFAADKVEVGMAAAADGVMFIQICPHCHEPIIIPMDISPRNK